MKPLGSFQNFVGQWRSLTADTNTAELPEEFNLRLIYRTTVIFFQTNIYYSKISFYICTVLVI
jgi:hypothetical protein